MTSWALRSVVGLALGISAIGVAPHAFAQAADTPFQVSFATDLRLHPTTLNFSNSGASSTVASPQNGALCANIYAFATDGPMIECCACSVPANNLKRLSVKTDVLDNHRPLPKEVVLKVMASTGTAGVCNAGTVATGSNVLATGLLAWKETEPFTPSTLSAAELNHINSQCTALHPTAQTCAVCQ